MPPSPLYVRHQMCLETIRDLQEEDDIEEKINGLLCALCAYYDGVSEEILNNYMLFVGLAIEDPVAEREIRNQVNLFHNADLLRIVNSEKWIDPDNESGFRILVDEDMAQFMEQIRIESRKFRAGIQREIDEYLARY